MRKRQVANFEHYRSKMKYFHVEFHFETAWPITDVELAQALLRGLATKEFAIPGRITVEAITPTGSAPNLPPKEAPPGATGVGHA